MRLMYGVVLPCVCLRERSGIDTVWYLSLFMHSLMQGKDLIGKCVLWETAISGAGNAGRLQAITIRERKGNWYGYFLDGVDDDLYCGNGR